MAFRKIKDLAVVTGSYTNDRGEKKNRYLNIGAVMEDDQGGQFQMIHAHFNPAGVPRKDGSESILVSMFDPKDRDTSQQPQSGGGRGSAGRGDPFGDGGDDVPFVRWDDGDARRVM